MWKPPPRPGRLATAPGASGPATARSGRAPTKHRWLGWLSAPTDAAAAVPALEAFARQVHADGFTDVLLLGMGGSSLCPEVLAESFGPQAGAPRLHVLDSTDPAQVAAVDRRVPLATTLVIVASKSGSTLEPNIFSAYFFDRMVATVGAAEARRHFVAITDPGSKLEAAARRDGFRAIFSGVASIGGRYSALSPFGLVPAAAMGLDLPRWQASAAAMAERCALPLVEENPGVALGLVLGTSARLGMDKLTRDRLAAHLRSGRVARAAGRRVHRQEWPRDHPRRP